MARFCRCPKCGEEITESYQDYDPDVGIMCASWYCDKCEFAVQDDDPEPEFDLTEE